MSDDLLVHIGKTIRSVRKAKNISMEEVSFTANISYVYLSQIEHGQGNLTIKVLYKIASALGVKPNSLLPENQMTNDPREPEKVKILETIKQLTAQVKKL